MHIANVGDSRAVLCRDGQAVRLTPDHSAEDPNEVKRAEDAGGFYTEDAKLGKRVNGLEVTRSLGDLANPPCICVPAVSSRPIEANDHFVIIASDGLWKVCASVFCLCVLSVCVSLSPSLVVIRRLRPTRTRSHTCYRLAMYRAQWRPPRSWTSAKNGQPSCLCLYVYVCLTLLCRYKTFKHKDNVTVVVLYLNPPLSPSSASASASAEPVTITVSE